MGDVDDVEDAERDRDPQRHGGIEPAQQDAGDQRIDQQVIAKAHLFPQKPGFPQDGARASELVVFVLMPVSRKAAVLASSPDEA